MCIQRSQLLGWPLSQYRSASQSLRFPFHHSELDHAALHEAANSFGVRWSKELCGCSVLNSTCHASSTTRACSMLQDSFMFRHSSRTRLLNDSAKLFCHGLPGSIWYVTPKAIDVGTTPIHVLAYITEAALFKYLS